MNPETKNCQNCKKDFIIESDDFLFYEKMGVPAPTWCPDCRQMRRMMFRNFKTLYRRPSSKSGKMIISMYSPDAPFPVYEASEWWADDWDAEIYGRDIDFERPLFSQLEELFNKVPHPALVNIKSVNCEYSNQTYGASNCYLVFGCVDNEECDYGHIVWNSKNSIDNLYVFKCEFCYECIDCLNCSSLFYSQECQSCADSIGLFDCRNCTDCIGCVGLRSKSYHIFNQQVSKEEYKKFLVDHSLSDPNTLAFIREKVSLLRKEIPVSEMIGTHNVDVTGNHIYNAHNVHHSFDIKSGENSKFGYTVRKFVDSYDIAFSPDVEHSYEGVNCVGSNILGSHATVDSSFAAYSDSCYNCNNIFGCMGLRSKSYCILNKQYSKEEYEILSKKLIEHMKQTREYGEFFPIALSPFAYNESIVNEYMPKTREEAEAIGSWWREDIPSTVGQETIAQDALPNDPTLYDSSLLAHILKCTECGKNYRFIDREINFYKRFGLPLPQKCFNCRHKARMEKRNPRTLFNGTCKNCGKQFKTSYTKEDQAIFKVYCTNCYQQEIV